MTFPYFKTFIILLIIKIAGSKTVPQSFICSPTLPHMSVGDYNLTESNFEKIMNKHNIVAIVVTAGWFQNSCKYESFWKELKDTVLTKSNVPLARVDFSNSRWITEHLTIKIERVPLLIFAKNKAYFPYNSLLDTVRIQNYLDKMTRPLLELSTLEEAENFFQIQKTDSKGALTHSIKVVGIFYNLKEMEEELNSFKRAAEQLIERPELYFATLLRPAEIKQARQKYQDEWFEDYSLSTIIIEKTAGDYTRIELSSLYSQSVSEILKIKTLPLIQEYNLQNHYEYEKMKLPMLVGVVDSANEPEQFRDFILTLEKVAANYTDRVHFTWVDGIFNQIRRRCIEHDILPTLAFNLILDPKNNTLSYPKEWPITEEKISHFVNDYITYSIFDLRIIYGMDKSVEKSSIYNLFTHVHEYGSNNLTSYFNRRKKTDFILLIFDSQHNKNLYSTAQAFNHVTKRFNDLQVKKLEFGVFDTFYFDLPDNFQRLNAPCFVMIPANQRQKLIPIPIGIEVIKAQNLMQFIQDKASFQFYLPLYPHIPEEYLGRFYREMLEKGSVPDAKSYIV